MKPVERIYAEMIGRALAQRGTRFFIVAEVTGEELQPDDIWTIWADSRQDALDTVSLYHKWLRARLPQHPTLYCET